LASCELDPSFRPIYFCNRDRNWQGRTSTIWLTSAAWWVTDNRILCT
jgi:hypothetical protein